MSNGSEWRIFIFCTLGSNGFKNIFDLSLVLLYYYFLTQWSLPAISRKVSSEAGKKEEKIKCAAKQQDVWHKMGLPLLPLLQHQIVCQPCAPYWCSAGILRGVSFSLHTCCTHTHTHTHTRTHTERERKRHMNQNTENVQIFWLRKRDREQ